MKIFLMYYDRFSDATTSKMLDFEHIVLCHNNKDKFRCIGKNGNIIQTNLPKGIQNNLSDNNKKMGNPWINYVKEYSSKNGMSYRDALRCPKCKAGYKKPVRGAGVIDEIGNERLIAIADDSKNLGENAGKKFISLTTSF